MDFAAASAARLSRASYETAMCRSQPARIVAAMLKLIEPPISSVAHSASVRERLVHARAVLCDLDGSLAASNIALPGAAAFARRLGERLVVVSNNSTHDPLGLSQELALHGLEIPVHRLVLAGIVAVETIARRRPGCRILVAGSAVLRARARMAGLIAADEGVDAVLLARDTAFDYRRLETIARELARGAELFVANPDPAQCGAGDRLVPETGALLAAVRACVPGLHCTVVGKPSALLYREALARTGVAPEEAVMLGNSPATDIAGARALGIDTILVGAHPLAEVASVADLVD